MTNSETIALIERLSAMSDERRAGLLEGLSLPDRTLGAQELLTRSICHSLDYSRTREPHALVRALADLHEVSRHGTVDYAATLWTLNRQVEGAMSGAPMDVAQAEAILDASGPDPTGAGSEAGLRALLLAAAALTEDSQRPPDEALRALDRMQQKLPPGNQFAGILENVRIALVVKVAEQRGEYGPAEEVAGRFAGPQPPPPDFVSGQDDDLHRLGTRINALMGQMMAASQRGDFVTAARLLDQIKPLMAQVPDDTPAIAHSRALMGMADRMLDFYRTGGHSGDTGLGTPPTLKIPADAPDPFEAVSQLSGLRDSERRLALHAQGMNLAHQALRAGDLAGLRRGIERMRESITGAPADNPHLVDYRAHLGAVLLALYTRTHDRAALTEATGELEWAARTAARPTHPSWASICLGLFKAYRAAGQEAAARSWGRRGLQGHAWSVLLQAGTSDATTAAERGAIDDAVEVTRAFLDADDTDTAALTLDAGRGLLLHSAATNTGVPQRLRRLGADDLALEWEKTGGVQSDFGSGLRYRVLARLAGVDSLDDVEAPGGLLTPPELAETRAALATLGADALVYLLPADRYGSGVALVVPRGEATYQVALPGLTTPPGGWLDTTATRAPEQLTRDAVPVGEPAADGLTELCRWAWSAAMEPLLDTLRTSGPARLVLAPVGALATVPWHAARSPEGGYAVERAVISYAASARLLCHAAWRPVPEPDRGGLVVADPTGDLAQARAEAVAVRDVFYPDARTLGGIDSQDVATPEALRNWLKRPSPGRSSLHLACHGVVGAGGGQGSYLVLAAGRRLSAQDILELREPAPVDVVTLAACTTAVASGDYDEAFSLATAFLASAASTVFGSLWKVPDHATKLLIFMTHHYLRHERLRPAEALRAAQLWMLDPDRKVPDTMPDELADATSLTGAAKVESWAGFTHYGR
ncbi:CHAT domain-containing protein [Cryptosporangium aurantiacum]|uniref:CHAT domain-containing protein n=1 Tax=Cryptosporangium aurantiacum TaxID=134849 RepID=A0A1M7R142_9ACTN|nr:CHAT domain-containing protein [Cryptosporangium aurantiacum]SHN38282.1 CHAT domain-containing protein [Cryptosporangium aurantiacum]